ncbi:hypothetical protein FRC04_001974 [Tulasnella sp. 424]|nr:hypothetical protein FRC04_001974 [Tulasnella sp. 424]
MVPDDGPVENFALLPAPPNTPPVDNSISEENYRPEMEVRQTTMAEQPGVDRETSTGSNSEGVNQLVDSVQDQPSTPGASHSLGTAPTINTRSPDRQIAAEELEASGYSSSDSSGGNTCQSDVRFQETSPETQDNSSVYDPEIMSISGLKPQPPPKHNLQTDRDYLVELFEWWALNPLAFSAAGIYARAAIGMPWHSEGSIRNYIRSNPELFGNPPKLKGPSRRSKKASSEYRQNQEVPDGCSYNSDDPDNEESDDMESSKNSDSEDNPDFDDMNDGSSFHDFPSDSEDSSNFHSIDDPDDQDRFLSNFGMDSSDEEEQPHTKDKGKGPGIRPSSEVFQAMVVKLSENLDAFFEQSNQQRKMKLWEAFAKSASAKL